MITFTAIVLAIMGYVATICGGYAASDSTIKYDKSMLKVAWGFAIVGILLQTLALALISN